MSVRITAYVTNWCPDCMRAKRALQRSGMKYEEIDIEKRAGADEAMRVANGGSGKVPTIVIESALGSETLIEPSERDLAERLHAHQQSVAA